MKHVKMRVDNSFSNMVIFQFAKCEFLRLLEGINGEAIHLHRDVSPWFHIRPSN